MPTPIVVPGLGESVTEATVAKWMKKVGDPVKADEALAAELARFPGAEIVWCQEEPKNMGPWTHVMPEIESVMESLGSKQVRVRYAGRPAAASPATGLFKRHVKEQNKLVNEALTLS